MSNSNIVPVLSFESDEIRTNADSQMSVFDFIRVVGGQKDPRKTWERMTDKHPEVALFCHNFKFVGKGQRETPVSGKEGILQILGLLPGLAGKKYRQEAARLVLAFYDSPEDLAIQAFDRITDKKKIAQTQARIEGMAARKLETNAFQATGLVTQGWQYGSLTNATYEGLLGADVKALKVEMGLKPKESLRDNLDDVSLAAIKLSELVAAKKASSASTFDQLRSLTFQQAQKVREAIS